jgi:phosphatidylserine synthase
MVSTIRFRSFKAFDLQSRRSYPVLILVALGFAVLLAQPELLVVALAYGYLASAFVGLVLTRVRRRGGHDDQADTAASDDSGSQSPKAV